jgi:hypothetical protein
MGKGHCDHLKWRIWPHKIVAALVSSVFFFTPLFLTFLLLAFCCRGSAEGRQTADGHPLSADDGDGLYDDDDPSAERAVEDKSREGRKHLQ